MNGAESLVKTLLAGGIDVCFTNPGTSEMHFCAALDQHPEMRCVLGLQENVVTGAADGYARIMDKPAATLLHLGPGLSNGLANIHNAKKARTSMVNVVGDHATYHREFDAPLTSDIEGIAGAVSHWLKTSASSDDLSADASAAITSSNSYPGLISTLILPADSAWTETDNPVITASAANEPEGLDVDEVRKIADILRSDEKTLLLIGGRALREMPLELASSISISTPNTILMTETLNSRIERGAGRVAINRIPYLVDQAVDVLKDIQHTILIEARDPVAFFAYPGKPSRLLPEDCQVYELAGPMSNGVLALEMLADELAVRNVKPQVTNFLTHPIDNSPLDTENIALVIANAIPENAIIIDEALTTGRQFFPVTSTANPHTWLQITGGAIGIGIPLAIGAAIAAPERPLITLQADGSGMFTVQGLWSQAREGLNVTTIIFHNRAYKILLDEMRNLGIDNPGPGTLGMFELDHPVLDWVALANGMGVEGGRATDTVTLACEIQRGLSCEGPYVIEAYI
jgi:acetolactate synthase-1/2/3 large subunit